MVPAAIEARAGAPLPARTLVVDMPDAGQAAVFLLARGPDVTDAAYSPLELANAVLGGGSSGRLFEEIRNERGLAYGSYSGISDFADGTLLSASTQTANETVDEVVQVMLDEFARVGSEPLADDLLERRRLFLTGGYDRSLESSAGYAGILSSLLTLGRDPAEIATYADSLAGVTAEQASAAAAQYFDPARTSVVVVGNAAAFIEELRAIRPDVEVIPASELDLNTASAAMGG